MPLHAGEVVVLFTDGVSEAMSREGVEYGEDRLERVLCENGGLSAAELIEVIHRDIVSHTQGAQQSDDITMMVARILA